MSVSNIRALFENMLFLSKSLEFDTKWMVSNHFLRIFFFISRNRRLLRILRNNKKTSVSKRMGVRPPFVVKKCTKKQRKQKNNWKKTTSTSPIHLKSCETKENTLYHFNQGGSCFDDVILQTVAASISLLDFNYISLTYSKTYNFKYKILTNSKSKTLH